VFKNKVLRRTFVPEREEIRRGLGKLHNDTFHNLYSSPNIRVITSRRMTFCDTRSFHGEMRKACKALVAEDRRRDYFGDIHVDDD
jgi:hypothetical protein